MVLLLLILKAAGVIGRDMALKVTIEEARHRHIVESVQASGKIYPETEVKIKSDVSGEIVELPVMEGDSVVKGQFLIKINPSIYTSEVALARAQVRQNRAGVQNAQEMARQAKAQLDRAEANFQRNEQLYRDKVISQAEYEQLQSEYRTARANYDAAMATIAGNNFGVEGASASLKQAMENLRRTTIVAPTSGVISQLLVKNGERVVGTQQMDGTQMMTIADMGRMEIRVEVSENDIPKVGLNDPCRIEVDAYRDMVFTGRVSRISVSSIALNSSSVLGTEGASAADEVTGYTVHILIDPDSYAALQKAQGKGKFPFKPGMSAGVAIETNRAADVLSVPINAVTTRDSEPDAAETPEDEADRGPKKSRVVGRKADDRLKTMVFVYDSGSGRVASREVETGLQDNEYIQILSGLKAGEQVVTAPYGAIARQLKDGMEVEPVAQSELYEGEEKN